MSQTSHRLRASSRSNPKQKLSIARQIDRPPLSFKEKQTSPKHFLSPHRQEATNNLGDKWNHKITTEPTIQEFPSKCYNCKKKASYRDRASIKLYCAQCGAEQLANGTDIVEYESELETPSFPKRNSNPYHTQRPKLSPSPNTKKNKRYSDIQKLMKDINVHEKSMRKWMWETRDHQVNMDSFFRKTKQLINNHYTKIEDVLNKSWHSDLQSLTKLQNLEARMFEDNRRTIQKEIQKLLLIKADIQPNIAIIAEAIQQYKYTQFMDTYWTDIKRIGNWINDDLTKRLEDVFLNKHRPQLYKLQYYTMVNTSIQLEERKASKQPNKGVLFSFAAG